MIPQPVRGPGSGLPNEHFSLPPLPGVVGRLLEALRTGTTNAGEVADLLASDPALVAQVLKIVNSAYYGLPRRIAEIKHAVAYLGLAEIERVVMTAGVIECFAAADQRQLERFWSHSFYTALISKLLVRRLGPGFEPEAVYTAALLHDVGKLVALRFRPDAFSAVDAARVERGCTFAEAEQGTELTPHGELGGVLCERWLLPELVAHACRNHELEALDAGETRAEDDRVRLVALANLLANLAGGELSEQTAGRVREAITRELGHDEQEFLLLMGEVYELRTAVDEFLAQL